MLSLVMCAPALLDLCDGGSEDVVPDERQLVPEQQLLAGPQRGAGLQLPDVRGPAEPGAQLRRRGGHPPQPAAEQTSCIIMVTISTSAINCAIDLCSKCFRMFVYRQWWWLVNGD